jgi:hypothetical protein
MWLSRALIRWGTVQTVVAGVKVTVVPTRPDIQTRDVLARLARVLSLIERTSPHYHRHLMRDLRGILVQRYATRGAYFPDQRCALVELSFAGNTEFSDAQVAACLLHEAMHARLHVLGFPFDMADRARQERFCRRAELEFGRLLPDGGPVVERALLFRTASDDDIAPTIDWQLAAQRVKEADQAARRRGA